MIKKIKIYTTFLYILVSFGALALPVKAATANFSTSGGGNTTTNKNINVSVNVNGSEAYNAITVTVNFSNLTYISASAGAGWTPVSGPSVSGNAVTFSGAVLGNSYTGSKTALNLVFKTPSTPGTSTIKSSGTIALANGSGTQISGSGNTVTYTVATPPPAPTATQAPKPVPNTVDVRSSSHPDSNKWYKEKNLSFEWTRQNGVSGFSYELNGSSDTNPDDSFEPDATTISFSNNNDGTYYFHIKAKNDIGWSSTSHYKVNIDNTSPQPFCISAIKESNDERTIYFATNDLLSGVQKYIVKTDQTDLGEQKSGLKISKDVKSITIQAFDNAGNTKDSTLILETGKEPMSCTTQPNETQSQPTQIPNTTAAKDDSKGLVRILLITNILGILISGGGVYYLMKYYFPGRNTSQEAETV